MGDSVETQDGSRIGVDATAPGSKDCPQRGFASTLPTEGPAPTADGRPAETPVFPVARWDRYTFVRVLGQGGMGAVYEAVDARLGRAVALKFIRGGDPRLAMRLLREARAQARIDHENICKVFEVGEVEGKAYIAMQLVEGRPLGEVAREMSLDEKVIAVRDVARALHEAHKLGILHRDIKPSNILAEATADGRYQPVLMDFGLARDEEAERGLTETGALLGTPAYMSPEQARGGRDLDRRSDVYSLGATLYELLSGAPPFEGDSAVKIVLSVLNEEPLPLRARAPSVPADLETIAAKCLSKEAGQRYESARALADDLDRYVRGEPILGRREGAYRRLCRFTKRHRALVMTALLAFIAVATFGGLAVRARVLAARQKAELLAQAAVERELGQDVKEMEWLLRTAHLLPLHDVTRERAIVKERMKRIEERAAVGGRTAALVDYAVGRGHLALGEDVEAEARLESASQRGLDTPELDYALGLVLGRRYERALAEARRGGDRRWIERKTKALEDQILRPALASMEKSRGVRLESPSYLEGMITYYRKDYDSAIALAQKARAEAPWLYEAVALEAQVHLTRGVERKDRGEQQASERDLEEAARLFDAAAEIGRSDAALYEGGAEARSRLTELDTDRGGSPEERLQGVIDRCERATVARPDRGAPYAKMAYAYEFVVQSLLERGRDPRPALARAIDAAERARAIDGRDFAAYERLSGAHLWLALYEMEHGLEPSASIDALVRNAQTAAEIDPTHPWGWQLLAVGHDFSAREAMRVGGDPTSSLRAALDSYQKAIALDEGYAHAYANALFLYASWARWLVSRGEDPDAALAPARDIFERCLRANPLDQCRENQGIIDYHRAEHLASTAKDPRELLAQAEANLEAANTLKKDYLENRQYLAALHLLRSRDAFARGEDPAVALASFGRLLDDCYRLDPKDVMCTLLDARRALLLADIEAAHRRPARGLLERAASLAGLSAERNPRDADSHEVVAEAERRIAAVATSPADEGKHREAGLAACARGLAINPEHPRLRASLGALRLLEARAAPSGAARADAAREAALALRKAVSLNPLLRGEVEPLLAEAERAAP